MNKGQISGLLRKLRLIHLSDRVRFYVQQYRNRGINRKFIEENPEVILPPDYLIYESFQINYDKYYFDGLDTAQWLASHFEKHIALENKKILDWGCGPGRIIRHLPAVIGNGCEYYGTDYNPRSIKWCSTNLCDINFNLNALHAKLPYEDNFFDVIYGISIFTHLSEQMHHDWYHELLRVLKPGGIMLITTQGDNFKVKLTESELQKYSENELVVRGNAKEGHRIYCAFHPKGFMQMMVADTEILEHIELTPDEQNITPQDVWILRK